MFSRLASWRYQHIQSLPEAQQVHVQVGLYALFHRLYGLFPCNFLSYLRTQYSDNNKDNKVLLLLRFFFWEQHVSWILQF